MHFQDSTKCVEILFDSDSIEELLKGLLTLLQPYNVCKIGLGRAERLKQGCRS